ncbi:protein GAMETE EXPRESSED 1 [Asparagus officinalis]|uniref:protein GAMETE EXPRESSED 1 n=1 Tax=Asparagus officinalis TaxID=4686 RepID=UPI00098DFC88|nr:protein GAMETE EXPRESSED 1 [Asparagus officinalis]
MANLNLSLSLLLLLLLCSSLKPTESLWWSSSPPPSNNNPKPAEFSISQGFSGERGLKIVEDAKRKMVMANTCWQSSYRALFESCSAVLSDEERKRRLAWMLSDCFQIESGRPAFPGCKKESSMLQCLKRLNDGEHKVFLEFFMETNAICHQLQSESFKHETERLVNELAKSAHYAEDKLDIINEKSDQLLQDSNQIHDSLSSIHEETEQLVQTSKDAKSQIDDVLENSQAIFQQSKRITETQLELKESQSEMIDAVKLGIDFLEKSYKSLGNEMNNLMKETVKIETEIKEVGDSMVSKMQNLQGTANNIESVAGSSLMKQMELLEGQNDALEGLDALKKFQSEAIKESRDTLEKFSEYGHKQHEELIRRQGEIQKTHDHLYETSQAILEAQREFELKQSDIFSMLEKLYALYKAILDESRFIKAFFFYSCIIILLYMLTSAKQTFHKRVHLYLGLCITLLLEMAIIKYKTSDVIIEKIWLARSTFLVVASIQILHSIFTYRDYEIMSHQLLQTLMEKVCMLEKNSGMKSLSMVMDGDDDDSWSHYSWIDEELPEDVDINEDPSYYPEEVAENFKATALIAKSYDLRPRRCSQK